MVYVIRAFDPLIDLRQATRQEITARYCSLLNNKRALLLLDNATDAAQVKPLVPPASCALLVTSRRFFTLPGLTPLRLDILPEEQACALLMKICARIRPHAAEIANACGYLPLALRIAASTLAEHPDISPQEYLQRLADRRQRIDVLKSESDPELDVRAAFDYSYALLSTEFQAYWRQLSVFPAPFDAIAAAAVWAIEREPAGSTLSLFVRVSLLDYDEPARRYSMHDLLASFADAYLSAEEKLAAQQRYAEHYARVAASADELYLQGGNNVLAGLNLFDAEWSHIRAGQAWAAANAQTSASAAQLCSCYPYAAAYCLALRLHPREWIAWLHASASVAHRSNDRRGEGISLGSLGNAYAQLGEAQKALEYYQQALAIHRETGDKRGVGTSLGNLGNAHADLGEAHKALEYYEQALAIYREIGDKRGEGNQLGNLGIVYARLGEVQRAITYYEQALAVTQEIGDRHREGNWLVTVGIVYARLGEVQKAIRYYQQALVIAQEIGDKGGEGNSLGSLGNAHSDLGEAQKALEYYEQALAISREIGDKRGEGNDLDNIGLAYARLGEAEKAIRYCEQALVIAQEIGDKSGEGNSLGNLGNAYVQLGEVQKALEYYEQALAIHREIGDKSGQGNDVHGLGNVYAGLGEVRKAIRYYQQALAIARQIGDNRGEGGQLGNLGVAYAELGELQKAVAHLEQALAIAREIGDRQTENALVRALRRLRKTERAPKKKKPRTAKRKR